MKNKDWLLAHKFEVKSNDIYIRELNESGLNAKAYHSNDDSWECKIGLSNSDVNLIGSGKTAQEAVENAQDSFLNFIKATKALVFSLSDKYQMSKSWPKL